MNSQLGISCSSTKPPSLALSLALSLDVEEICRSNIVSPFESTNELVQDIDDLCEGDKLDIETSFSTQSSNPSQSSPESPGSVCSTNSPPSSNKQKDKKKKRKKTKKKQKKDQIIDEERLRYEEEKRERKKREEEILSQHLPGFLSGATHKRIKPWKNKSQAPPRASKPPIEYHNNKVSPKHTGKKKQTDKFKTEICRNIIELGKCPYGRKCRFAHSDRELKTTIRHYKFKSKLCVYYHYEGICMYGPRCCYIHNAREEVIGNMTLSNIDLVDLYQNYDRLPIFKEITEQEQLKETLDMIPKAKLEVSIPFLKAKGIEPPL